MAIVRVKVLSINVPPPNTLLYHFTSLFCTYPQVNP